MISSKMNDEPEEKSVVVNFSGGRTSAYMVWLFEQRRKNGGPSPEYIFCDTGAEHPATYRFINEVVDRWGINLTCLRTVVHMERGVGCTYRVVPLSECKQDLVPFRDYIAKYGTPSPGAARCTNEMKTVPCDKYCNDKYGRGGYVKWLGIRADEPHRIRTVRSQLDLFSHAAPIKAELRPLRYLGEIDDSDKQDVNDFWEEQDFNLELTEERGNCVFCIKKATTKIALAARREPEMAEAFHALLSSPDVYPHPAKFKAGLRNEQVYRGHLDLPGVMKSFIEMPEDELARRIELGRAYDTGNCSESCEAISIGFDFDEVTA